MSRANQWKLAGVIFVVGMIGVVWLFTYLINRPMDLVQTDFRLHRIGQFIATGSTCYGTNEYADFVAGSQVRIESGDSTFEELSEGQFQTDGSCIFSFSALVARGDEVKFTIGDHPTATLQRDELEEVDERPEFTVVDALVTWP